MANFRKLSKRKRGVTLSPVGWQRLQLAQAQSETEKNYGYPYTLEDLQELTGLSPHTLTKVRRRKTPVDKRSLEDYFSAFDLILAPSDYIRPISATQIHSKPIICTQPEGLETGIQLPNKKIWENNQKNFTPELYIERPPVESICYETLLKPGALVRLKAPSLMGKTFLITRILSQITLERYCTVNLSFALADRSTHLTNLDKFLRWFCLNITRELGLSNQLEEYWDEEGMGSKVSCTTYFEEYLLLQIDNPLVLCLDDLDLLFPYPEIYEDFFGLLRSWHEKARSRKLWPKLRLLIAYSTNVYIRLNINQSPFNVGVPIELPEFTREQVREFAKLNKLKVNQNLEDLMTMVGGHPYLLQQAFSSLNNNHNLGLEELVRQAPTDESIYGNHLREHWLNLQQNTQLATAFKQVVIANRPVKLEPISAYQLQSMGLVKLSGNQVEVRCNLYRRYFGDRAESF